MLSLKNAKNKSKFPEKEWLTINDLVGNMPEPFPQSRERILALLKKYEKQLKLKLFAGESKFGNRWIVKKDSLEKFLKDLLK